MHARADRDRWLVEGSFDLKNAFKTEKTSRFPTVSNYDYDSIMHYRSYGGGTLRWKDRLNNKVSYRQISPHDVSRLLQYYARDYQSKWDFFKSLSISPGNSDSPVDPFLAPGVRAVGTPAMARLGSLTHIFVPGDNQHMYWKIGTGYPGPWKSLGYCAGSEPAAVASDSKTIQLAFFGAQSGKLIRTYYRNVKSIV